MNPNTLRLITAIIGICTLISGLGDYADIIPPHYVKIFGLIMIAAVSIKEWAVRVGDLADDGQLNGSFKPEQPKQPNSKPWMSVLLFAASAFLCGCYLTSCSNVAQEALKRRAEEAALEVGKQATVVGVEGTLNWLRKELKTLEAKPVDEDPYQQLIDQNRISALKAAIKSGEEQLAKLRAPSAKQPIVVQIEDKKMTGKKMGSQAADIFLSDIFLSPTSSSRPNAVAETNTEAALSAACRELSMSKCGPQTQPQAERDGSKRTVRIPQFGQLVAAHLASN